MRRPPRASGDVCDGNKPGEETCKSHSEAQKRLPCVGGILHLLQGAKTDAKAARHAAGQDVVHLNTARALH
jgi:hypothetical protein